MKQERDWILTDDSSCQHVRKIDDHTYELIQMGLINPDKDLYAVYSDTVYLDDYQEEEIAKILEPFGYSSIWDMYMNYAEKTGQIVAECVFESRCGFADEPFATGLAKDEAEHLVFRFVRQNSAKPETESRVHGLISMAVNNGGVMSLSQLAHDKPVLLTVFRSQGESEHQISPGDMVMLMNYWRNCKKGREKSDYIKAGTNGGE